MDASTSMHGVKMQKLLQGQNICGSEDRLSCLPQNMVHHILSFLPTKYAVGTSILSRKWRYLWTSVYILDFDDDLHTNDNDDSMEKFMNFVDRVLLFHESNIEKFCLICTHVHDAPRVNAWISTVVRRQVCELVIDITFQDSLAFPRCLCSCESLTVLKLKLDTFTLPPSMWPKNDLELPSMITLPSLKVLHLDYIRFSCGQLMKHVTFNFPVLEELHMGCCSWMEIKTINIFAPLLEILDISDNYLFDFQDLEMKIYAPSVRSLQLRGCLSRTYSLNDLPSIEYAHINLHDQPEDVGNSVVTLLRTVSHAKKLRISLDDIEALIRSGLSSNLPEFFRMTKLRLFVLHSSSIGTLIHLLCKMPLVESLAFTGMPDKLTIEDHYLTLATFPNGFLSRLKSVKLENFLGSINELSIVQFFLKNVRALEKVTLISDPQLSVDPEKQNGISKQLLMLSRVSECIIDFC